MNTRLPLLIFGIFASVAALAQIKEPAKWTYAPSSASVGAGSEVELIFKATIQSGWHLYSTEFPCEDGPMKAVFSFVPHASYKLAGAPVSVNPIGRHDDTFDCDVKYFSNTGEFRQKIKVQSLPLKISGELEYQVCSEASGQCIPGTLDFIFDKWTAASSAEKKKITSGTQAKITSPKQ